MKNIMGGTSWLFIFGSSVTDTSLAGDTNSMSLLVYLFLAVLALIIGTQVIPACVLLLDAIKILLRAKEEKAAADQGGGSRRAP